MQTSPMLRTLREALAENKALREYVRALEALNVETDRGDPSPEDSPEHWNVYLAKMELNRVRA